MVRKASLPPHAPPPLPDEASLIASQQFILHPEDLQAFLNRVFLEESIQLSPGEMSPALLHIAKGLGSRDSQRIVEFLADKVIDLTVQGSTNLAYRPVFRVLSDMLLNMGSELANCQGVVSKVAAKSSHPCTDYAELVEGFALDKLSRAPARFDEAELLHLNAKLLHRLATCSAEGFGVVTKSKEHWRDLGGRLAQAKGSGINRRSMATSSVGGGSQRTNNVSTSIIG